MSSAFPSQYEKFISELKAARKGAGVTQDDVNASLGLHRTFMSKVETGERRVDVAELIEICKAIGTDPTEFVRSLTKSKRPV